MRYVFGGLWLIAQITANLAALPSTGRDASFEEVTIEGRIYDRVGVPKSILETAKLEAAEVFRLAGVRLQWVDCTTAHDRIPTSSSCDGASTPLQLSLNILGPGQSRPNPVECGYALGVPAGSFADWAVIYYHRVENLTDQNIALRPVLLANVIAHEFGHLLLGPSSHSSHGIMAAKLPANVPVILRFASDQLDQIRKAVLARVKSCSLGVPSGLFEMPVPPFTHAYQNSYVPTANGQRFLVNTLVQDASPSPITVVLNWAVGLKAIAS